MTPKANLALHTALLCVVGLTADGGHLTGASLCQVGVGVGVVGWLVGVGSSPKSRRAGSQLAARDDIVAPDCAPRLTADWSRRAVAVGRRRRRGVVTGIA